MRKRDKDKWVKKFQAMSDEDLSKEYSKHLDTVLHSEVEIMAERQYPKQDIIDRERYEDLESDLCDLAETVLNQRGIDLWKRMENTK